MMVSRGEREMHDIKERETMVISRGEREMMISPGEREIQFLVMISAWC